jgi:hypothetical protein
MKEEKALEKLSKDLDDIKQKLHYLQLLNQQSQQIYKKFFYLPCEITNYTVQMYFSNQFLPLEINNTFSILKTFSSNFV